MPHSSLPTCERFNVVIVGIDDAGIHLASSRAVPGGVKQKRHILVTTLITITQVAKHALSCFAIFFCLFLIHVCLQLNERTGHHTSRRRIFQPQPLCFLLISSPCFLLFPAFFFLLFPAFFFLLSSFLFLLSSFLCFLLSAFCFLLSALKRSPPPLHFPAAGTASAGVN